MSGIRGEIDDIDSRLGLAIEQLTRLEDRLGIVLGPPRVAQDVAKLAEVPGASSALQEQLAALTGRARRITEIIPAIIERLDI